MSHWVTSMIDFFMQYGMIGLFILSFVEASFFPIPPYLLSIPMTLANPRMGLVYALVGVAGSVLGGILGYAIGFRLGRPLLLKIMKPSLVTKMETSFSRLGGWSITLGGLTPIPFKLFSISAGVFRVPLLTFIPASFFARSIRFVSEALLLMIYGRQVVSILEHALSPLHLAILALLLLALFILWRTGFFQRTLLPLAKRVQQHWQTWYANLRSSTFVASKFSWYIISGGTLTAFGFLFFTKLATELLEKELSVFDITVNHWIIPLRSTGLTSLMQFITNLGSTGWVVGVIVTLSLIGLRNRKGLEVLSLNICVIGALLFTETLKLTFQRARPSLPWLASATGYSFPSGHSLISMAFYGFIAYLIIRNHQWSRWRFLGAGVLILIAISVGISRIYLGVHYPSDVLAGWLVALTWIGTCIIGLEFLQSRQLQHGNEENSKFHGTSNR